jgi:hypothetical protein
VSLRQPPDYVGQGRKDPKDRKLHRKAAKGAKEGFKQTLTRVRRSKGNPRRTYREASRANHPLRRGKCLLRAGKSKITFHQFVHSFAAFAAFLLNFLLYALGRRSPAAAGGDTGRSLLFVRFSVLGVVVVNLFP